MKVYVLTVTEDDFQDVSVFKSKKSLIKNVKADLADRYHFDTDEPYITKEELEAKQAEAEKSLLEDECWEDDGTTYRMDAAELED